MMNSVSFELVTLHNIPEHNVILGQAHFIKSVEDLYEAMITSVPRAAFGVAFCEASSDRLIRHTGTDEALEAEAIRMMQSIGAGHSFVIVMKDMFPINVLPRISSIPEVVRIYCATANPVQVAVVVSEQGRGIIGVIDGGSPLGVESEPQQRARKAFLRKIGYKQ
jgi:adenosine/AMP kinase